MDRTRKVKSRLKDDDSYSPTLSEFYFIAEQKMADNERQNITFASSFSNSDALITMAPLTAYSICLMNGFMVSPVRTFEELRLPWAPLATEKKRVNFDEKSKLRWYKLRDTRATFMADWNLKTGV